MGISMRWGHRNHEKPAPLRKQGLGNPKGRSGLPAEMYRVRAPDYDVRANWWKNTKDLKEKS